jgi:hypothetical protein
MTQPDSPAAELRAAAQLVREHVGFLRLIDIRGPFKVHAPASGYPQEINNVGVPILIAQTFTDPKAPPVVANWIALMHPGVGEPIAQWLDDAAARQDAAEESAHRVWRNAGADADDIADRDRWIADQVNQQALATARALLGTAR